MNKRLRGLVNQIFYIWQFPQTVAGLCVAGYFYVNKAVVQKEIVLHLGSIQNRFVFYVKAEKFSGLCLGNFIFIHERHIKEAQSYTPVDNSVLDHEYGHSIQSLYLGVFYLLIIGLPSLIRCQIAITYYQWFGKMDYKYYKFYTEAWADKLGKVNRVYHYDRGY